MDVNSIHHETEINHLTSPLELVKLSKVGMKESEVRIKVHIFWEDHNFCDIYVVSVKSTVENSQNFVAFSEYMNFNVNVFH